MSHFTVSGSGHLTCTSTGHFTVQEPTVVGVVGGGLGGGSGGGESGGGLSGSSTLPGSTPSWDQAFRYREGFNQERSSGTSLSTVKTNARFGTAASYFADLTWKGTSYTETEMENSYLIMDQYHLGYERRPGTNDWYHLSRDRYMYLLGLAEFADTPMIKIPSVESGDSANLMIDDIVDDGNNDVTRLNGWSLADDTPRVENSPNRYNSSSPYGYFDWRNVTYMDSTSTLRTMYNNLVDNENITVQDFFTRFVPTDDGDGDATTPDSAFLGMTETLGAFFLCGDWLNLGSSLWLNHIPTYKWDLTTSNTENKTHRELFLEYTQTNTSAGYPPVSNNNTPIHDYMMQTGLLTRSTEDAVSFVFNNPT